MAGLPYFLDAAICIVRCTQAARPWEDYGFCYGAIEFFAASIERYKDWCVFGLDYLPCFNFFEVLYSVFFFTPLILQTQLKWPINNLVLPRQLLSHR